MISLWVFSWLMDVFDISMSLVHLHHHWYDFPFIVTAVVVTVLEAILEMLLIGFVFDGRP